MLNTKISRLKLKDSKFFSPQNDNPSKKYISAGLTPRRKNKESVAITELKTEKNDLNSFLTSQKMNIKKKLKVNKTEFLLQNNKMTQTSNNKMNKTFYKLNIPMNKVKSLSDLNSNLYKSNYSSQMTQTSVSFFNNKQKHNFTNLRKIQKIKNLELNQSYIENKSNIVTYIDYHINQILTKKKQKINYKIDNHKEFFNNKNNSYLIRNLNLKIKKNNKNHYLENNNYIIHEKSKDNEKDKKIDNKLHINKIYFQDELENLFHKIIIIKNNKREFENFVMSLTNEELKLLYENQNILPLLIKNRSINYKMNEAENFEKSNSKIKEDKKFEELKSVNFGNNILNLFLKSNKKSENKNKLKNFPNISRYETDKNNISFSNYDIDKNNPHEINKTNKLSKSQIYKKINLRNKKEKSNEENNLKKDLEFLGYKNKLSVNIYNKEEIKKGEKIWQKWIIDVINKNKEKNLPKNINNIIYNNLIKKEEEEFKKIIYKKIIRQNSSRAINNIKKEKIDLFILPKDIEKINKENNNSHNNKSQIINKERVFDRIKQKFNINIISYINTSNGKLSLKMIFNSDTTDEEKNNITKNIKSNQNKIKLLLQTLLPISKNKNNISNAIIKKEDKNKNQNQKENEDEDEKNEETEEENEENNTYENLVKNFEHLPISLKKFFLEKYKITDARFSRLSVNSKNYLKGQKSKKKKFIKNVTKKIIIKTDNHNEKMVKNFLSKLNANKDKKNISKRKKENENIQKDKDKEKLEIIVKKKDEKRIINLFGLNIVIKKSITPIQHLRDYMIKKGISSSEELKSQIKLKNDLTKLISKLEFMKKKKKGKRKVTKRKKNFSKILDINYNEEDLIKLANDGIMPVPIKSKRLRFFDPNLTSRKDIEKRKMQLLLKFKNDIDYKAMNGEVDETEVNMYSKLEENIGKLMDLININEYVAKMEDYIGEFQEELKRREQSRKDEKRINGFIEKLKEDFDNKMSKKEYMLNRYGKAFNYNFINPIINLNGI